MVLVFSALSGCNFGLDLMQTAEASAAQETLWSLSDDLLNSRAGGSRAARLTRDDGNFF